MNSSTTDDVTNKEDYLKENSKRLESQFEASTLNYVSVPTDNQDGTSFMHRYIENTLDGHISSDENANTQQIVINNKNNEKPKTKKHSLSSNSTNNQKKKKKNIPSIYESSPSPNKTDKETTSNIP